MFRKLVSHLSFSPALIHEVGFYARRLKKEETTRQLTLVFMALALVVQSLAVFSPPESANAASEQDIIQGGVTSKDDFLKRYQANESNIRDILSSAGITSSELEQLQEGTINSKDNALALGRQARFGEGDEIIFEYTRSDNGQVDRMYLSQLSKWDSNEVDRRIGNTYDAYIGTSAKLGWFAIIKSSGSFATKQLPAGATTSNKNPVTQQLTAINLSQGGLSAAATTASSGDRISYTLTATNNGTKNALTPLAITIDDASEYATVIDNGAGNLDKKAHLLSWQPVSLAPGQSESRTFVMQIRDPIPATPTGISNPMSYDCALTSAYGTSVTTYVTCPSSKSIEAIFGIMPSMGATGNFIFSAIIGGLIIYFYLRTRQLKMEIRRIRHNLNQGTL